MNTITIRAHAKINLGLEILGRRPDGYHDLLSVFQGISLADELECTPAEQLALVSEPALPFAENLALRAAVLLGEAARCERGAALRLRKHIPIAAGLGGGSADAAAALVGLRRLWGLTSVALAPLAERLGSDVPYFLGSATALVSGRGEVIDPLPAPPARSLVLLRPRLPLATSAVFAELRPEEWTDGAKTLALARTLAAQQPLDEALLTNDLLAAAERCCPPLGALRLALCSAGLRPHLSGSGPTLFVFAERAAQRRQALAVAEQLGAEAWPCRTVRCCPLQVRSSGGRRGEGRGGHAPAAV